MSKEFVEDLHRVDQFGFPIFEMANFRPKHTGVNYLLHCYQQGDVQSEHGPRVKIALLGTGKPEFVASVSISDDPKFKFGFDEIPAQERKKIIQWIRLNKEVLLDYWTGKIEDTVDFVNAVKRID